MVQKHDSVFYSWPLQVGRIYTSPSRYAGGKGKTIARLKGHA